MKSALKGILITLRCITLFVAFLFGTGLLELKFLGWYAPQKANVQREVFLNTKSYSEGMARDLAKLKAELQSEKDPIVRKAIIERIIEDYANFDSTRLEVASLRKFLEDIQAGQYVDGGE